MLVVNFGNIDEKLFPALCYDMFNFVKCDIDDERAAFTKSLAWQGPQPSV